MSFDVSWYYPGRVIHITMAGRLDLEDVAQLSQQVKHLLDQGSPPVHVLGDVARLYIVPNNMELIMQAADVLGHPALGWWIAYHANPVIQFVGTSLARMSGTHFRALRTLADALYFLELQDPSLKSDANVAL